ncbi:hypothetical protein Tco_1354252 [Tanacetum coccineum]
MITTPAEVPHRKLIALKTNTPKLVVTLVYSRKPKKSKTNVPVSKSKVVQIVLWYLDSGCSKNMNGDRSQLTNFVNKFLENDWDLLFQPMFDELLTPPPSVDHPALEVIALIVEVVALVPAESTGSPSSTTVDKE